MPATVVIDIAERTIDLLDAPVNGFSELSITNDIYSQLKQEWLANTQLHPLRFPMRSFGDSTGASQIGPYIFIDNRSGWRLKPYPENHELNVTGNLIPESAVNGDSVPLWNTQGSFTVIIRQRESAQALTNTVTVGGTDANGVANAVWAKVPSTMAANSIGDQVANKLLTKNQFLALKD